MWTSSGKWGFTVLTGWNVDNVNEILLRKCEAYHVN